MGLAIGLLTDREDRIGFSKVLLVWGPVLDAAMAMLAVVPLHKAFNPTAHGIPGCETDAWGSFGGISSF